MRTKPLKEQYSEFTIEETKPSSIIKGYGGASFSLHISNWEAAKAELAEKHFCYEATQQGERVAIVLFAVFDFNTMLFEPA